MALEECYYCAVMDGQPEPAAVVVHKGFGQGVDYLL